MSTKASAPISNQQDIFARKLVEEGRYASLSAAVQRGLELVRQETELKEAELAVLQDLLNNRRQGGFVAVEEGEKRTGTMMADRKSAYGL